MNYVKRGEVYYANLSENINSKEKTPVLIVQNNIGNRYSPTTICCQINRNTDLYDICPEIESLNKSVIAFDKIRTISKSRIKNYIGSVNQKTMDEVTKSIQGLLNTSQAEVCYADFSPAMGSEQDKVRPSVIIEKGSTRLLCEEPLDSTLLCVPMTKAYKVYLPTHVVIEEPFLEYRSTVLGEQLKSIEKVKIRKFLGYVNSDTVHKIDEAIRISILSDH